MKKPVCAALLVLVLAAVGCRSRTLLHPPATYRDPISYSFEAETPRREEKDLLEQFLSGAKDATRRIREWEKKHLW